MNLSRLLCFVGKHEWSRWATKREPAELEQLPTGGTPIYQPTLYGARHCKRCRKIEIGAAPKRGRSKKTDAAQSELRG